MDWMQKQKSKVMLMQSKRKGDDMEIHDYVAIGILMLIAGCILDSIVCNICRTITAVKLADKFGDDEEGSDEDG